MRIGTHCTLTMFTQPISLQARVMAVDGRSEKIGSRLCAATDTNVTIN